MYIIKMMGGDTFTISKETYLKLAGQTGLIHLKEIDAIINLNSVTSIVPKELSEKNSKERFTAGGRKVIKKFGNWYLADNPDIRMDLNYYPELRDEQEDKLCLEEKNSNFSKELLVTKVKL